MGEERVDAPSTWTHGIRRVALWVVLTLTLSTVAVVATPTSARATDYPGADEVAAAKAAARSAAASVQELDAAIIALEEALHRADVEARIAQESYAEAQWANVQAQRQLFAANTRVAQAEIALEEARGRLAILAMAA